MWFKKGKLFQQGNVKKTVENYLGSTEIKTTIKCEGPLKKLVKIENAIIRKNETEPCSVASRTDALTIQVTYEAGEDLEAFEAFCGIDGQSVRVFSIPSKNGRENFQKGKKSFSFRVPKNLLRPGTYFLGFGGNSKNGNNWLWADQVMALEILEEYENEIDRQCDGLVDIKKIKF